MQVFIELFFLGGIFMWPLLFMGIISVSIFLERLLYIIYTGVNSEKIRNLVLDILNSREGDTGEILQKIQNSFPSKIEKNEALIFLKTLLENISFDDAYFQRLGEELIERLQKRISLLLFNAQMAPLLGLLGTVSGMIQAFKDISGAGEKLSPLVVAEGIWIALITTAFGLIVAIMSYTFHYFLSRIIEKRIGIINLAALILTVRKNDQISV